MTRPLHRQNWHASLFLLGAVALAACGGSGTTGPDEADGAGAAEVSGDATRTEATVTPVEPVFTETVIEAPEDEGPGMHVHGLGEFSAAIDGSTLVLSLRSPMYNLVGFERAAADEAEEALLTAAKATLRAPEVLFEIPDAAGCTLTEGAFTFVQAKAGKGDAHNHEHDDDDDHDHGDDEHDHGDDDHDHAEDEGTEGEGTEPVEADADAAPGLGDLIADWTYACTDMDEFDAVSVVLFDEFERFETLSAVAIGEGTETADLTRSDNRLDMPG